MNTIARGKLLLLSTPHRLFSSAAAVRDVSSQLSPAVAFILRSGSWAPSSVQGTGRAGRILKGDVLKAIKEGTIKPETKGQTHAATAPAAAAATATAPKASAAPAATPAAVSAGPSSVGRRVREYTDVPLTNIRKVIASRLSQSKQSIPHAYASTSMRMDAILTLRADWKAEGRSSIPSVNDLIIRASALALRRVPQANTTFNAKTGEFTQSDTVDISVAVATDTGLITPIVKRADTKRLDGISAEVRELANKAKLNKLKPEEFQGGSFTISNLGMFGISNFSAIINPPQVCILAVGGSVQRIDEEAVAKQMADKASAEQAAAAATKAAASKSTPASAPALPFARSSAFASPAPAAPSTAAPVVVRLPTSTYLTVTLVSDERAVDGETAANFLAAFKSFMENPLTMQ